MLHALLTITRNLAIANRSCISAHKVTTNWQNKATMANTTRKKHPAINAEKTTSFARKTTFFCSLYSVINNAAAADRQDVGVFMPKLVHLLHLFFAFLEASEVVLDEERGVELADSDLVVSSCGNNLVQQLRTCPLPDLLNHSTQLFVCLVDVTCHGSIHLDERSNAYQHTLN